MKHLDPHKPCACTSGRPFQECCRPYLRGEQAAPDPVSLMRSRFSAFALDHAPYLWSTLHSTHPDRQKPEADVLRSLRRASRAYSYDALQILDHAGAQVLFLATLSKSAFVERSGFAQEGGAWKYVRGDLIPAGPESPKLTPATFQPSPAGPQQP